MDQFDKEIKEELHTYFKNEIKIKQKEKQRLNESLSRMNHKKMPKIGYYASLAGVLVLLVLLVTPMVNDFENNKPGAEKDNISENHPEKDNHLNEKEVPVIEDIEEDENKENDVDEHTEDTNHEQQSEEEKEEPAVPDEESSSFISIKDGTIYIRDITLGMSSSEVITILGEPLFNGTDPEDGFYDTTTKYDDMYIGYYQDKASTIHYNGSLDLEDILNEFSGPKYQMGDSFLFHSPEKQMIVKIEPYGNNRYGLWLGYEDPNFHYSLEQGVITPLESTDK
ncbi:hypothetical protein V7112_04090 [Bacillus sp. JJ1566]|uniref:hypothetical protein n=1 Tax=Bacillus sp. JJ1566 TaxID=3122961 RepID=UPI002FFE7788